MHETHETLIPPTNARYPITLEQIAKLSPGSVISSVPAENIVKELFDPVRPGDSADDLATRQARRELVKGETLDLTVDHVNPADETIAVTFTLPGNSEVWWGKNKHQAELKYNFFTNHPLLEKAGRALKKLFN